MKPSKNNIPMILGLIAILCFTSCVSLKPYEKIYVNDPEMQMANNAQQDFQNYFQSIREGSITPGAAKSSGGCGCN